MSGRHNVLQFVNRAGDCIFAKKKTKSTLCRFSIFLLKTSTLDSRVLIVLFFQIISTSLFWFRQPSGRQRDFSTSYAQFSENRVLILLAIYTGSSSVLYRRILWQIWGCVFQNDQTTFYLYSEKKEKEYILTKISYRILR